jgi:hypothetical protein
MNQILTSTFLFPEGNFIDVSSILMYFSILLTFRLYICTSQFYWRFVYTYILLLNFIDVSSIPMYFYSILLTFRLYLCTSTQFYWRFVYTYVILLNFIDVSSIPIDVSSIPMYFYSIFCNKVPYRLILCLLFCAGCTPCILCKWNLWISFYSWMRQYRMVGTDVSGGTCFPSFPWSAAE